MPEKEKKPEIVYVDSPSHDAMIEEYTNEQVLTSYIKVKGQPDLERYGVDFFCPKVAEDLSNVSDVNQALAARYDCDINCIIAAGIRQFTTRPNYPAVTHDDEDNVKDNFHQEMQTLADGYQAGRRTAAGPTQKAKAQRLDKIQKTAADMDMDLEKMIAAAKAAQEAGLV